jgi:hypothetical protein
MPGGRNVVHVVVTNAGAEVWSEQGDLPLASCASVEDAHLIADSINSQDVIGTLFARIAIIQAELQRIAQLIGDAIIRCDQPAAQTGVLAECLRIADTALEMPFWPDDRKAYS